ncbi:hypothetical protein [Sinorhizobium sp. BG8]|uniref:sunset domain-containing protein n=1 Tax=Sinorhizobium sp. BG8 TaxID=2613773 RepID=UPI00193DD355|nr:hypothetical protein [Sinorhizobium sp. BG8]QRM54602.1 hypothetical protein F3Y30_08625 [Sinorhizobium sp. BG8]
MMHPRFAEDKPVRRRYGLPVVSAIPGLVFGGILFILFDHFAGMGLVGAFAAAVTDCQIKGNIGSTPDERIYYVPGQQKYDGIRIRPGDGERWFCSEADARMAGWERARN